MSSSDSESDEDYVPGEPEKVSEEESANEETDLQFEKELDQKAKKRKVVKETKGTKKPKTRNCGTEEEESPVKAEATEEIANPEEQKKKEDDLWAMFLEGTDSKPKPTSTVTSSSINASKSIVSKTEIPKKDVPKSDDQAREKRIFEFAGETIVVENNTIKEKIKTADSPATVSKLEGPSRGRPGLGGSGLSGVLGALNKKNKLSTLEKSKLDWSTYKHEEGLEEEIQSHNKGRNGFLDKRDFLERADVRQYELERDMRLNRRSNR